jgi:hypothetical protein
VHATREVKLGRLDAGSFGCCVLIEGVLLGLEAATTMNLGGTVRGGLASHSKLMKSNLVLCLYNEVPQRRKS